jgi:hypothetical protein
MSDPKKSTERQQPCWNIQKESGQCESEVVSRWNLEHPSAGCIWEHAGSVLIRGWALAATPSWQSKLHVVIRLRDRSLSCPLWKGRADVVEALYPEKGPEIKTYLRCGFEHSIPAEDAMYGFKIGFEVDGVIHNVAKLSFS